MRVCVIGRVANGEKLNDGQTVLTRQVISQLKIQCPELKIVCVDTYNYRKRALQCIYSTVKTLLSCKVFIMILSLNGRDFYFPIMYFAKKFLGKKVIHRVIGGAYDKYLQGNAKNIKYAKTFDINLVEGEGHTERVRNLGLDNVESVINFKDLPIVSVSEFPKYETSPFRFCTFSRVMREKGIADAAKAVINLNKAKGKVASLDIFGPVEDDFRNELEQYITESEYSVKYGGNIDPEKSVEVLKNYFMLLFPTTWKGEGFPGTLIDAFCSGLPTIATDWNCNPELLSDGITGILYDWNEPQKLEGKISFAIDNPDLVAEMRYNCIKAAKLYTPKIGMRPIVERIKSYL